MVILAVLGVVVAEMVVKKPPPVKGSLLPDVRSGTKLMMEILL